jgi:hypothetical protein
MLNNIDFDFNKESKKKKKEKYQKNVYENNEIQSEPNNNFFFSNIFEIKNMV